MRNIIVGTAGHVDHGKTCLIRALTGIDTDRLIEEKKRGITIELGFANLPNDNGLQIGIIDVPGHERFVKNMLAGIGGIDLVLLVIALDEGVMPQTIEHFEILKMLGIRRGIVVLTKADMVDEEWMELVREDVTELVRGSFLENAEQVIVSSYTGEGIELLRERILFYAGQVGARREAPELFRLPIDRVFTMDGFGAVVTGTLLEGCCRVGQDLALYPGEKLVKVRGLQNHSEKVESAFAGQRTAINLTGIKKEELSRGEVLAAPGPLIGSRMIEVRVRLFSSGKRQLKNGDRIHLNYGSAQTLGRAVLLDCEAIGPGEEAYAQLRFDEPIAVKRGDRFIIRFYSPIETFGGGVVLEAAAGKHKAFAVAEPSERESVCRALHIKEVGSEKAVLEQLVREESGSFVPIETLAVKLNETKGETTRLLEELRSDGNILMPGEDCYIHMDYRRSVTAYIEEILKGYHEENPINRGMEREELRSRLVRRFRLKDNRAADALIKHLSEEKVIASEGSAISLPGFAARYAGETMKMREKLAALYREAGLEVPATDEVLAGFKDKKLARQILEDMVRTGLLVKMSYESLIAAEHREKALSLLLEHFRSNEKLSLGDYRTMLGTSRKYAVFLLEHFDQQKITKKVGDERILLPNGKAML